SARSRGGLHAVRVHRVGVVATEHDETESKIIERDRRLGEIETELVERASTRWDEHLAGGRERENVRGSRIRNRRGSFSGPGGGGVRREHRSGARGANDLHPIASG